MQLSPAQRTALTHIGENIDRLITVDVTARGVVDPLYRAARAAQGEPLTARAARALYEQVAPNDVVILATGMPVGPLQTGEQDGPVGMATLARSLVLGLKANPVILTDPTNVELMTAAVRSAGLFVYPLAESLTHPTAACVMAFPVDEGAAQELSDHLLHEIQPKALISSERAGANEHGEYHAALGRSLTQWCAKVDILFERAKVAGILTIGVGDGGNELGCGLIRDAVLAAVPNGRRCQCPCEGSVVPRFVPDVLIIAAISNWGTYGIEASLAALTGRREVLHDRLVDERVHIACAAAGAHNDGPLLLDPGTDAVAAPLHGHILDLMALIIENGADLGGLYRRDKWPWLDR
jgi:D-glutamate cyclase